MNAYEINEQLLLEQSVHPFQLDTSSKHNT